MQFPEREKAKMLPGDVIVKGSTINGVRGFNLFSIFGFRLFVLLIESFFPSLVLRLPMLEV
jgi:hypothetical protein